MRFSEVDGLSLITEGSREKQVKVDTNLQNPSAPQPCINSTSPIIKVFGLLKLLLYRTL